MLWSGRVNTNENSWLDFKRAVHNLTELEQFCKEYLGTIEVFKCARLIRICLHRLNAVFATNCASAKYLRLKGGEYLCRRLFYILYF